LLLKPAYRPALMSNFTNVFNAGGCAMGEMPFIY
jgi:hypothetical protein